jgi:hypothetical protein
MRGEEGAMPGISTVSGFLDELAKPRTKMRRLWEDGNKDGALDAAGLTDPDLRSLIKSGSLVKLRQQCESEKPGTHAYFWIR